MSQQLTIEINDEVYADFQQKANSVGLSIPEWIVAMLTKQSAALDDVILSPEQQEQARQRFRKHAGVVCLGYATGIDNIGFCDGLSG